MSPLRGRLSIEQLMSRGLCEPAHPKSEHAGRGALSKHLRDSVETAPPSAATWRGCCPGQGPNAIQSPPALGSPEHPASRNSHHGGCQALSLVTPFAFSCRPCSMPIPIGQIRKRGSEKQLTVSRSQG